MGQVQSPLPTRSIGGAGGGSLPAGASTSALQTAGNAILDDIKTAVEAAATATEQEAQTAHLADIVTAVEAMQALLTTQAGYLDGVETLITATNAALSTLGGYMDGLEGLVTSTNGFVDGIEGLLGTLNGYVDGLETLSTSTNTKLDTLIGHLDTVETLLGASPTYTAPVSGELQGSTSATQGPNVACKMVQFRALASNAGKVYLGGSGVTIPNGTTDTTSGLELAAGQSTGFIPVDNLNRLYRICDNAGDDLVYLALA